MDLGAIYSNIYEVRRLIDPSGSRWQQNAQNEWHPKNPHYDVFHQFDQMIGKVKALLGKSGFDPEWTGTGDGSALAE